MAFARNLTSSKRTTQYFTELGSRRARSRGRGCGPTSEGVRTMRDDFIKIEEK